MKNETNHSSHHVAPMLALAGLISATALVLGATRLAAQAVRLSKIDPTFGAGGTVNQRQ